MFMRNRSELLIGHDPRKDFLVALHPVDEELIKHPLQVGREVGEVIRFGRFNNLLVPFGAGANLIEKQLIRLAYCENYPS